VAYGGNFYAIVDEQANYKGLDEYSASQLIFWSKALRDNINRITRLFTRKILPSIHVLIFYGAKTPG
jgi:proline racemase